MRQLAHAAAVISLGLLVAGCPGQDPPASVLGGECRLTHTPEYAVKGQTPYDQAWINRTEEALVTGCNQPRPLARPPELDGKKTAAAPKPPAKKNPWWKRKPPPAT